MGYLTKSSAFVAAWIGLSGAAFAQAAPPADGQRASESLAPGGDIIVTATKREEASRDVAATLSAVTVDQIDAAGPVTGVGDLLRTIPGARFNSLQSENLAEVSIRGSGTGRATSADSGVGLFVNGAYAGSSTLGGRNFKRVDYFDLARAEVLKGPQGALYGRNSEYGVVNIVLQKPEFRDSGRASATYTSELGQTQVEAVVNRKLSDDVAIRLGAQATGQSSGFFHNGVNGKYYDHTDGWIARGQLRFARGPLDVVLLVDAQDMTLPSFANRYEIPSGKVAYLPKGYTAPMYDIDAEGLNDLRQKVARSQLIATYDLGGAVLTSTTMASRSTSQQHFSAFLSLETEASLQSQGWAGLYPFSQNSSFVRDKTLYEDLHLSGTGLDNRLSWLVGAEGLFQDDRYVTSAATNPCTLTATSGICGGTPTSHICYKLTPTSTNCPATYPAGFGTRAQTSSRYYSAAAYGSAKYRVGQFQINGELRYSYDDKHAERSVYAIYTDTLQSTPTSYDFNRGNLSYTATASYFLPGSLKRLVYGKVGSGYRAGGINNGTFNAAASNLFQESFGDERTTSFELGAKAELTRQVYLQVAGFTSRTNDAITSISDGCTVANACKQVATTFNVNGGTIRSRGVEASLDGRFPVAGGQLSLGVNGSRQTARFIDVPNDINGGPVVGSLVAQTPKWTMAAQVGYFRAITENLNGFVNVTYNGQRGGGQDTVTAATPFIPLSDIDNVNLRVGINQSKLTLAFFAQNLTNQVVPVLRLQSGGIPLSTRYSRPRTMGANVTYKW